MIAAEFARFLGIPVTRQANITDIIEAVAPTRRPVGFQYPAIAFEMRFRR
jgi:hypothetical protein